jgi:hypothetical protein
MHTEWWVTHSINKYMYMECKTKDELISPEALDESESGTPGIIDTYIILKQRR